MTVRTSMEKRERVEITFSFDNEEEANVWVNQFQAATEAHNEKVSAQEGPDPRNPNRPVPKQAGSGSVEVPTTKKKSKLIV